MLGFALPQNGEAAHDDLARFASTAEQLARQLTSIDVISDGRLLSR